MSTSNKFFKKPFEVKTLKKRVTFFLSWQFFAKPFIEGENLLINIKEARKAYLCLLSVFNETPGNAHEFEAILYHLLAAEKLYFHWLKVGRENQILDWPLPYSPDDGSRGIYFDGHWLPW